MPTSSITKEYVIENDETQKGAFMYGSVRRNSLSANLPCKPLH